jgi:hypothetical protein
MNACDWLEFSDVNGDSILLHIQPVRKHSNINMDNFIFSLSPVVSIKLIICGAIIITDSKIDKLKVEL